MLFRIRYKPIIFNKTIEDFLIAKGEKTNEDFLKENNKRVHMYFSSYIDY